jgi:hypothetical protein
MRRLTRVNRITPGVISRREARQEVERLRYLIPTEKLLSVMSRAALTGHLLNYDAQGNLIPGSTSVLDPADQMALARYLLSQVMPVRRVSAEAVDTDLEATVDAATVANVPSIVETMTNEQLHALVDAAKP